MLSTDCFYFGIDYLVRIVRVSVFMLDSEVDLSNSTLFLYAAQITLIFMFELIPRRNMDNFYCDEKHFVLYFKSFSSSVFFLTSLCNFILDK